jgi:hypothetical protein
MADNFLQFSFMVPGTVEQGEWLTMLHETADAILEQYPLPTDDKQMISFAHIVAEGHDNHHGIVINVGEEGICIYADTYGDPEYVADLLGPYLEFFKIDKPVGFEWSYRCSKARPGEFGGGACVVSRGEPPEFFGTSGWLRSKGVG